MNVNLDKFYSQKSEKFKTYAFKSKAKIVKGGKPDFFKLIKKYSDSKFRILDLGCGSGELTLKLSPYFKDVIGIDPFEKYIKTANKNRRKIKIKNVTFKIADGKKLPFPNEYFDIVYSSRGPLSSNIKFLKEGLRVLKTDGLLIEETIGEKDKIELKKIFGRGQNYPSKTTRLKYIKEILDKTETQLKYAEYFTYFQKMKSIDAVINLLDRAPIIPDFKPKKDRYYIASIRKRISSNKGIILSSHRLHWIAQKRTT